MTGVQPFEQTDQRATVCGRERSEQLTLGPVHARVEALQHGSAALHISDHAAEALIDELAAGCLLATSQSGDHVNVTDGGKARPCPRVGQRDHRAAVG
jgi:hypothetical protein